VWRTGVLHAPPQPLPFDKAAAAASPRLRLYRCQRTLNRHHCRCLRCAAAVPIPAYNALINSCAAVGDLDRGMGVLQQMYEDENCLPPDAITFTSLIKTAAAAHNAAAAEEVCYTFALEDTEAAYVVTLVTVCLRECVDTLTSLVTTVVTCRPASVTHITLMHHCLHIH
jgi:pentatricopeptide repeat protein